jgi:hypothetical protein
VILKFSEFSFVSLNTKCNNFEQKVLHVYIEMIFEAHDYWIYESKNDYCLL